MKRFRLFGLATAAALAVAIFVMTAGIGAAKTVAAPSNTQPPQISGTAQVGQTLKTDNGNWNGTTPFTYTYQWRLCDKNGSSCQNIPGANGNEYVVKSGDQDNTIRVQVTAKNSEGSAASTSVPTAVVTAASNPTTSTPAPTPSSNGCPKMAAGASSVAVADVASPARLQIDKLQASSRITFGTHSFTVRFHVSDTCGDPVQGAQVYATGVPYNMISIPAQQTTDAQGWVSMTFNTLRGYPATPNQRLLVMFVRASKPGDPTLAGVSTRRLVSLHVSR